MAATGTRLFLAWLVLASVPSCLPGERGPGRRDGRGDGGAGPGAGEGPGPSGGRPARPSAASVAGGSPGTYGEEAGEGPLPALDERGEVVLQRVVDPADGSYVSKVTLPRNFDGILSLGGLNVSSLADRLVKVRFRFGRGLAPVVLDASVGRRDGITPQTEIGHLNVDMGERPFRDVRLLYDLFDYNDYRENGVEAGEPADDPRDPGLYCRGLRLEHDPTFEDPDGDARCSAAGERCLYAYAKIRDQGLVDEATGFAALPSSPQIDVTGEGYGTQGVRELLGKCLPDNLDPANFGDLLGLSPPPASVAHGTRVHELVHEETGAAVLSASPSLPDHAAAGSHVHRGPFKTLDAERWEIAGDAVFSQVTASSAPSGVFQFPMVPAAPGSSGPPAPTGRGSFLFPRATRMELDAGVAHLAAAGPFSPRSLVGGLVHAGETGFMDGCNRRARTRDGHTGEDAASCNVTAVIEVLRIDDDGVERVLHSTRDVKVQLVRPSRKDADGRESLFPSLEGCVGSSGCAAGQCCFNGKCVGRDTVTACPEEGPSDQRGVGEPCGTDYECASFCCRSDTSTCGVHVDTELERVLCGKAPGQPCVDSSFCRQEYVPRCFKVKTGVTPDGRGLCARRCYRVPTPSRCVGGRCVAPVQRHVPIDTSDCSDAIDPPRDLDSLAGKPAETAGGG